MMKKKRQRWLEILTDEEGASIVLALVAFMVAAMVAVTLITAAVTAAKRIQSDRQLQQAKLTLNSAADLLRSEMKDVKYTETTTVTKAVDAEPVEEVTVESEGSLKDEIKKAVDYVDTYQADFQSDAAANFCIDGSKMSMEPVDVSFIMLSDADDRYNITFTLTTRENGETVSLSMYGNRKVQSSNTSTQPDGTVVVKTVQDITWSAGTIY